MEEDIKIATHIDLLNIKTNDNNEDLINISEFLVNCLCIYEKNDMIPYTGDNMFVRKSVAEKLDRISIKLNNILNGHKLKIVYGYRHPEVQKQYFLNRKDVEAINNFNFSDTELNELTHEKVAFPEVAGHPTGGALDITITTDSGDLDMGTKISDFSDIEKIKTFYPDLTEEQKKNRKLLHDLMIEENFAPFYGEWWHFSYGDKEWAWFYNKPNAIYDSIYFEIKKVTT